MFRRKSEHEQLRDRADKLIDRLKRFNAGGEDDELRQAVRELKQRGRF